MTRYSKEFKEQVLKLSDEIGIKKASEQLGVVYGTIADWRKNRNRNNKPVYTDDLTPLTELEKRLMKELQEVKNANEILKDALGFFAKDRKK